MFFKVIRKLIDTIMKVNPQKRARKLGVHFGENCRIGNAEWGSEPWLIWIGDHSELSFDVAFITHDGATWGFRNQERYRDVIRFGKIVIGNNCFIGARSTIMPGVTIGDNAIVGACSLVTKSIPANEVWGGVPAHYICSTQEYAEKCLKETPKYDPVKIKTNLKDELLRIL